MLKLASVTRRIPVSAIAVAQRVGVSIVWRRDYSKIYPSADKAIEDIPSGSTILFGGFGLCGIPEDLIGAVANKPQINNLTAVSNNAG
ncbi:Succinyl-CoA:3-ketoacid coenzyme A transferase 1, mitochondrial, partial [Coemansia sp. S2]